MRPDKNFRLYPRYDQEFKKQSSLDIQRVQGNFYGERPTGNKVQVYLWILCLVIGVIMSTISFLMDILVNFLVNLRQDTTQKTAQTNAGLGWFVMIVFSFLYLTAATAASLYIASTAIGSGVAAAMGIMKGAVYPNYVSLKALVVKFVGVSLNVAGGLCDGKEGPFVHIGAIVGEATAYLPIGITQYF